MDKELKEYLDTNMATKTDLEEFKKNMATKTDLEELKKNMATKDDIAEIKKEMSTKDDKKKLDKKIDHVKKDLIGYLEHLDNELQEHRHSSEIHQKVMA
ncbi:MAG: hypothetical protein NT099_08035 [Candidatus Saganbacteria bacterium]|nr:hypothetical protein [Candidatus Saganbacteria bacterium]